MVYYECGVSCNLFFGKLELKPFILFERDETNALGSFACHFIVPYILDL